MIICIYGDPGWTLATLELPSAYDLAGFGIDRNEINCALKTNKGEPSHSA